MPGSLFPPLWPSAAHTSSRPAKREPLEAYGAVTFDAVVAASSTGAAVPRFLFLSLFLVFFLFSSLFSGHVCNIPVDLVLSG